MIFNPLLTKYLIRKGVNNTSIFVINTIIITIVYSILYRHFYLNFELAIVRIAIALLFISNFVFTLLKVNSIVKSRTYIN